MLLVLDCTRPSGAPASGVGGFGRYQQWHCDAPVLHTATDWTKRHVVAMLVHFVASPVNAAQAPSCSVAL